MNNISLSPITVLSQKAPSCAIWCTIGPYQKHQTWMNTCKTGILYPGHVVYNIYAPLQVTTPTNIGTRAYSNMDTHTRTHTHIPSTRVGITQLLVT